MILIPNFHSRAWDHNRHYVYKCISQIEASATSNDRRKADTPSVVEQNLYKYSK